MGTVAEGVRDSGDELVLQLSARDEVLTLPDNENTSDSSSSPTPPPFSPPSGSLVTDGSSTSLKGLAPLRLTDDLTHSQQSGSSSSDDETQAFNMPMWNGFKIVGDNLNKTIRPCHQTLVKRTQQLDYFQSYAVKDSIDLKAFSDVRPHVDWGTFCFENLLPSSEDLTSLKDNFGILVARVLVSHVPALSSFKS